MKPVDVCIFCGPGECECIPKKKPKPRSNPKPKKKESPPPGGDDQTPIKKVVASKSAERLARPPRGKVAIRPEHARKSSARPERDGANLINTERNLRSEDAEHFWVAMRNLFNQDMIHSITVKRSLDAYPNIPGGIYE